MIIQLAHFRNDVGTEERKKQPGLSFGLAKFKVFFSTSTLASLYNNTWVVLNP